MGRGQRPFCVEVECCPAAWHHAWDPRPSLQTTSGSPFGSLVTREGGDTELLSTYYVSVHAGSFLLIMSFHLPDDSRNRGSRRWKFFSGLSNFRTLRHAALLPIRLWASQRPHRLPERREKWRPLPSYRRGTGKGADTDIQSVLGEWTLLMPVALTLQAGEGHLAGLGGRASCRLHSWLLS